MTNTIRHQVAPRDMPPTKAARRLQVLPVSLPRRGLPRELAAAYWGISPGTFDKLVADGRAPQPKLINSCQVWDRLALDLAFDELPDRTTPALEFAV